MKFRKAIPILYSTNVVKSLDYYTEVLGFANRWEWGEPPTFGGIYDNNVEIFFCETSQGNPGTWISVMLENVDEQYERIKAKGAKIIMPPATQEWGIREMLVEDPDKHIIRFGHPVSNREKSTDLPAGVRIVARAATGQELQKLMLSVGWIKTIPEEPVRELPVTSLMHAVVAEDTTSGEVIGCAYIYGNHDRFFYLKDMIVQREWQSRRIGTAILRSLTEWLDANAPDDSAILLHTGEQLAPFYQQFDFTPMFGMCRSIRKNPQ